MKQQLNLLQNELKNELHQNILPYWMLQTIDTHQGGFVGSVGFLNEHIPEAPKGSVLNARILWTFSAAFRFTGNQDYYNTSKRAYNYLINYFFDKQYGGVFWELSYTGEPLNTRKQIYALSFALYGLVEYYRATGEETSLHEAINLFELIERHSFDKEKNGYIEALSRNWQLLSDMRLSDKDANESKTMNTHLHILEAYTNLYRVYKNQRVQHALKNLIELFLNKFINSEFHLNLFFDDGWNLKGDHISFGHDIECSWLLYEAAEVLGEASLIAKVKPLSIAMAKSVLPAIDSDGGMYNEYKPANNSTDTDKHWWPQAEAMVGFYNAYQLSGDERFVKQALASWNFIKNHIIDKKNGEWFWRVNKKGTPYETDEKAGFWKCPYHNSRACLEIIERINVKNKLTIF
jgi:mannobiose 2-epimerase